MASPTPDRKLSTKHDQEYPRDSRLSPKRKTTSESGVGGTHENNGESGKKKRRKVNHACVYCRRSHMTCDLERPCARCIKRDIGHLCHDEPRDPPKRSKSDVGVPDIAPAPGEGVDVKHESPHPNNRSRSYTHGNGDLRVDAGGSTVAAQSTPLSPSQLQRPTPTSGAANGSTFLQNFDWNNNGVHNQFQDMHHLHPSYMFNTSEATNEYNLLNEFLSSSLLDDGGIYSDDAQGLFSDSLLASSSTSNALAMNPPGNNNNSNPSSSAALHAPSHSQAGLGNDISRPSSAFPVDVRAREKFYMVAADPAGLSSAEDRLHKLFRAKYDAGMLKPFNYVKGYAQLNNYMSANLSRASQLRILKQLDRFRPKFREAMQTLTDMQLVLVELRFEQGLMEYDRVFASMAIPACCWRRTGEIFRGNTEMAELIKCPLEDLRDGKLAIHEVIAEDSLVSYWEKFGAIAFDNSQKAILTSCSLMLPEARAANALQQQRYQEQQQQQQGSSGGGGGGGGNGQQNGEKKGGNSGNGHSGMRNGDGVKSSAATTVRCCFSFTIRRDLHNIPSLIVGNFLPIQS